jgi:hypothetical protein
MARMLPLIVDVHKNVVCPEVFLVLFNKVR